MRRGLILFSLLLSPFVLASSKDVLIIHSYHHGFFWTDQFQQGLDAILRLSDIRTRVVYLDTKRLQSDEYLEQLYRLYQTKLTQEHYDAIVVSDNSALELMQRLAPELGATPILFGGINHYSPEIHRHLNATGVTEDVDIKGNIALIQQLQPEVKTIYVVTDQSITGEQVYAEVQGCIAQNQSLSYQVKPLSLGSFDDVLSLASQLNDSSSVVLALFYRDSAGRIITPQDIGQLSEQSGAPIYLTHDFGLGFGAVGGVMQNARMQGQQVASQLLQVFAQPNQPLPSVVTGMSEVKLDYRTLKNRLGGIDETQAVTVINRPLTFAERYQYELRAAGVVIVLLVLVIIGLFNYLSRLRKRERLANENQTLIELVFDQSYQLIGIFDYQGRVVSANNKLRNVLHSQDSWGNEPLWLYRQWQPESAQKIENFYADLQPNSVHQFEAEVFHPVDGGMCLELTLRVLPQAQQHSPRVLLEARDITARKLTEARLFENEATLSYYYNQQPVMMITLDEQNRIQRVNSFVEQLLGYHEKQLLGHRLNAFYVDDNALLPRQILLQPKQAVTGVWHREVAYRHYDGRSVWIRENIRPLAESGHLLIAGEDVTETRLLAKQLAYQAQYDMLTDIYNRNHFEQELDKALKEVANHTRTHAMLYLDLDQLKVINDTAGHDAGDAAIQFCSRMLQKLPLSKNVLARMGGDEFAILVKDCTEHDAIQVARSIITNFAKQPFVWGDIRLNITCSIGIRLIDHTATSPQMVHAQADTACHVAKEEGRNRYNLYRQDDQELLRRQMEMNSVNLVHRALEEQRVELFAQRIMNLVDDTAGMHFEILVRIRDNQGQYLSPGIFMPASERYNIAHLIDKRVVEQTLTWLEAHPEQLAHLGRCAINLSGQSMGNQAFVEYLLEALSKTSVACEKICLEITETAAMSNMNQAIELFSQLKQLGCVIALDDFGSGLSSFGYLKKLPVDVVKIDGLFVRDMANSDMDHVMVRSIHDLAKQMGKQTVAEFVENSQIIDLLVELGVDYAQGYVVGKPKPLADLVEELMLERQTLTSKHSRE